MAKFNRNDYVIETFKGAPRQPQKFFWRLKRAGKILATSEAYSRPAARNKTVSELLGRLLDGRLVDLGDAPKPAKKRKAKVMAAAVA